MEGFILHDYHTIYLNKMKHIVYIIIALSILLSGCFEEDERIIPIPINEIEIPNSMYEYQTYFNISNQSVVATHHYSDWDLGFESGENGFHIILNYARYMYAGNTYRTDFQNIKSNVASTMAFDASSGELDSTILNDWADFTDPANPICNEYVYILDRGKNEQGDEFGIKKIIFEKLEADTFYIHFANLDNTEEYYYKVPKDTASSFTLFSLDNGGEMVVSEPDKDTWHICFTKYSTRIPDNDGVLTDYLVRGVFLNPYKNIEVALDTVNYFDDILPEMIADYLYSDKRDAIGYDWKVFNDNTYQIRDYNTYILKNVDGLDYKLRFTAFYNEAGEKGYPSFELTEF